MAHGFLSEDVKILTYASTAAGTSTITQTTGIDTAGFDGTLFIIRLGTPATNNNIRVMQCATASGTYADLAGTLVGDHASDTPLVVDVRRSQSEFLKYKVTRGTSTTIDTVVAIQYKARTRPVTQITGLQLEKHSAPSEGTA